MGHLVRELSTTFLQHTRHQSGEVEVVEGFHAAMFLGSWFDLGAKVWLIVLRLFRFRRMHHNLKKARLGRMSSKVLRRASLLVLAWVGLIGQAGAPPI